MNEDDIHKAFLAHTIKTIKNYLDDKGTAEGALADIATMLEVRGLHDFGDAIERLPPP